MSAPSLRRARLAALALGLASAAPAAAQNIQSDVVPSNPAKPSVSALDGGANPRQSALQKLLADGYEIKAAFVDSGAPYVFLQKSSSAFLCKGGPKPGCEKLN